MTSSPSECRKTTAREVESQRQEEAEQSFLKSFQDIKTIVLTKLQVFDKQIESKEEWERMREVLQSE